MRWQVKQAFTDREIPELRRAREVREIDGWGGQAVAKGWMEEISSAFSSLAFRNNHSSCKASQYSGRFPK